MFYVQHLMGIGHQKRMAAIARACAAVDINVTYVSGGLPVAHLDVGSANFVQLAPCRSPDLAFDRLVDADGNLVSDAWRQQRVAELLAAWTSVKHQILVVETYPFGRKLMRFELALLLAQARRDGAKCVSSIRDIIDYRPKYKKYQAMADVAKSEFEHVLVHSDPNLVPLDVSFPAIDDIAGQVVYTGYVRESGGDAPEAPPGEGDGEVIVSAGGGGYGHQLLLTALVAQSRSQQQDRVWRVLVGQNAPVREFEELALRSREGIVVERARPDFRSLLRRAAVSVSLGGYNTVMDVLSIGVRSVLVAYHDETEREQLIRGQVLARRGLVTLLPYGELNPDTLADAVERACLRSPAVAAIDMDGAATSARLLSGWL